MINSTQLVNGAKVISKAMPKMAMVKPITTLNEVPEQKVLQYLSSLGHVNIAKVDTKAMEELLRKELISTRAKNLKPIENIEEYKAIIDKIKSSPLAQGIKEDLALDYKNVDSIEEGLVPYCGDHSNLYDAINKYLSGRGKVENEEFMQDVVRVLDFSLKELDKKFGKFDGMVFRQGTMKSGENQFWSTSISATGAGKFGKAWNAPEDILNREYSVIKTKSGHRITEFQKAHANKLTAEEEILLSREKDYKLVPQEGYTEEILEAREKMLNSMFQHNDKQWKKLKKGQTVSFDKKIIDPQTGKQTYQTVDVDLDYLRNMIKVFEEI